MLLKTMMVKKMAVYFCLSVISITGPLSGCSDDPESINEEEVITKITVTLTPAGSTPVILSWDDINLNSIVDTGEITSTGALLANKAYAATIELLNESADPDISGEVEEEAEDHIFCFEATDADITFSAFDTDSNGQRLGLTSTWTTGDAGEGTVNIKLRHQPGFKTGDCPLPGDPAPGETDIDLTFDIEIVNPA